MQLSKRIESSRISEQQYRDIKQALNYSAIRIYVSSRYRFFKEFILGETRQEEMSLESLIGSMAHVILAQKDGEFDSKYVMASVKEPAGQMMELVQSLYKYTVAGMDESGKQTRQFEQLFLDAIQETKYDYDLKEKAFKGKTVEQIVALFTETDKKGCCPELFYKELCANTGKQTVTISQITAAEKAVEMLRQHPFTQQIVNLQTGDNIEVFNELPILWKWEDVPCKSLIDKLIIDHENKLVMPVDWKFTWDENFSYSYVKNKYWLQVGMYNAAVYYWLQEHGLEHYKLAPMQYVICDPVGNTAPLVYQLSEEDVMKAMDGFTIRQVKYPGVVEVLANIQYGLEHSVWNCSPEAHRNNGQVTLRVQYDNQ